MRKVEVNPPLGLDARVQALRKEFDESFSRPVESTLTTYTEMLLLRIDSLRLAVSTSDVSAIVAPRVVVPVPGISSGAVGVSGVRGQLIAVFDLGMELGCANRPLTTGWLLLTAADRRLGLLIPKLEGFVRVAVSHISPGESSARHVSGLMRDEDGDRTVVDLGAMVHDIRARSSEGPK